MDQTKLTSLLESILFVSSKPLSAAELAKLAGAPEGAVRQALSELFSARKESGIVLLESGSRYQLATNPENVGTVTRFLNAELREQLTDATVEVLGIVAYRQPISKTEIEAIRGVNSQYSLRQLLMRGLIEKVANPQDARSSYYQTTTEFLQHMGLRSVSELPDFQTVTEKVRLPETPQAAADAAVQPPPEALPYDNDESSA